MSPRHLLFAGAVLVLAGAVIWTALSPDAGAPPRQRTSLDESGVAYVSSDTCIECHREQYEAWSESHHDLAMQQATPATVVGDFDNRQFTHFDVTSRFFRRGDRYFVNTEGPDGEYADYEIGYTFGVEPLQQYLIAFPGGRLQSLSVAWDTERGRWFHLYPDERIPSDDPFHWTGTYQRWNLMCAECHSTNLRKNFDPISETYRTEWDEIDVACQACHGPGEAHLAWARGERGQVTDSDRVGLVTGLATTRAGDEIDGCARCHSRRQLITPGGRHGRTYLDNFVPATLREGLYHADGQILDEVYVYGSFVQSKMYEAGVRCSDCHDPHSLDLVEPGNGVCTQCHRDARVDRQPTLEPKDYDTPDHHFHQPGSAGAACVNCHAPERTYMVVDPRRDHSFRVPRADLSVALGTPNACTLCHADESDGWAAARAAEWWGPSAEPNFATAIAAGRAGDAEAEASLIALAHDTAVPGIVRATTLELLSRYGPAGQETIAAAVGDADPLVRMAAAGSMERLAPERRVVTLLPLLDDSIAAVRIEAARVLASVPSDMFPAADHDRFQQVLAEYVDAQMVMADMPAARLRLALLHQHGNEMARAEREYLAAIRFDPRFLPARFNLATLYNQQGRNAEAEQVLREGIERISAEGELHYSLALLLAEERRLDEAAESLGRAVALIPDRARMRYNYGLVLQQLGRMDEAEEALLAAHELEPSDPDLLLALAQLYAGLGNWTAAERFAADLVSLVPEAEGPRQLLDDIRRRGGSDR